MSLKHAAWIIFSVLLAGCITPPQYAQIDGQLIRNPSFGIAYEIPEGFTLYRTGEEPPSGPLQQMAMRIYDLNRDYHPSGNETFYESFLMFSGQTAFLLIMVERDNKIPADMLWDDGMSGSKELMPLYNVEETSPVSLDSGRILARLTKGTAYERKGWHYSRSKPGRTVFSYEACKIQGLGRDNYILIGFSFPENRHVLSIQMQEMIRGFQR